VYSRQAKGVGPKERSWHADDTAREKVQPDVRAVSSVWRNVVVFQGWRIKGKVSMAREEGSKQARGHKTNTLHPN